MLIVILEFWAIIKFTSTSADVFKSVNLKFILLFELNC